MHKASRKIIEYPPTIRVSLVSPIEEVRQGVKTIAQAYRQAGVAENFTHWIEDDTGHVLSKEMWRRTRDHFQKHLRTA